MSSTTVPRDQLREVVAREVEALLRSDWDDDPIGDLDDMTLVLLHALGELDEELAEAEGRAWNPSQHKRWPKGHPLAGKFRPMVELLKEAIRRHDGKGHPFDHFDRPQLLKAAKARGIALKRGEDRNSIAAKLLADLGIGKAKVVPASAAAAKKAAPVKKAAPAQVDPAVRLREAEDQLAEMFADLKRKYGRDPDRWPDPRQDRQVEEYYAQKDRVARLRKQQGAGVAEPKKAPAKKAVPRKKKAAVVDMPGVEINKIPQVFPVAPDAYEVKLNGVVVGHIHGNEADPDMPWVPFVPGGAKWNLLNPGGKDSQGDAAKELVNSFNAAQLERDAKAAAKNAGPDLDKMNLFDLVRLANQHGIDHVGQTRRELAEQLRDRMRPQNPGKYHRSLAGLEDLQNLVENGAVVNERRLAGGAIGDTRLREYTGGTKVVWKRSGQVGENDSEQLSSKVARALGLQAPRIYRNRDHEVNMDFVEGDTAGDVVPGFGYMVGDTERFTETDEGRMMGLLDQLIANTDRHNGNWMIRSDSRLVPIDHGYAFGNRPGAKLRDGGNPAYVRSTFAAHFTKVVLGKLEWQPNDLSKRDIRELRKRIEALRPDFEHLGRANWHQFMMERLDAIGQHATGTKSRLLTPVV